MSLKCGVCHVDYPMDPIRTRCGHSFCHECLYARCRRVAEWPICYLPFDWENYMLKMFRVFGWHVVVVGGDHLAIHISSEGTRVFFQNDDVVFLTTYV